MYNDYITSFSDTEKVGSFRLHRTNIQSFLIGICKVKYDTS